MNLGFIILAHNQPAAIRRLTEILTSEGDRVVIHFDSSASAADLEAVQQLAEENPDQIQVISKVHCVWGEWSLVEAVLLALRKFKDMPDTPDYVHLMSGADYPIHPIADLKAFLRKNSTLDFIESCDISKRSWVKGGLEKERYRFYFLFNFRTHREAFDRLVHWQRKLKIRRRLPLGLKYHMGSQWWTLRWATCEKVLDFTSSNPVVSRFFKTTWIPDESYFQTVMAKLIPKREIANLQLMFHHLTPTGRPYVFYNDHLPFIRRLPHFFIRKVSPGATKLWEQLGKPNLRQSRIPSLKSLHGIRDFLHRRIDRNYQLKASVPSHPDYWYGPELKECKEPVIALFLTGPSQLAEVSELVSTHPDYAWLGRPFAPNSISIPDECLSNMGMSRSSWKIRDHFRQQFIYQLLKAAPASKIPVFAILPIEDFPDFGALKSLERFFPLLVQVDSLESFVNASLFWHATTESDLDFYNNKAQKIHQRDLDSYLQSFPGYMKTLAQVAGITAADIAPAIGYLMQEAEANRALVGAAASRNPRV